MRTALERSDILILTGGLGPTQDDLTKGDRSRGMEQRIENGRPFPGADRILFKERGLEMTENNKKQALVPEGAIVVDNDNGTAPRHHPDGRGKADHPASRPSQ